MKLSALNEFMASGPGFGSSPGPSFQRSGLAPSSSQGDAGEAPTYSGNRLKPNDVELADDPVDDVEGSIHQIQATHGEHISASIISAWLGVPEHKVREYIANLYEGGGIEDGDLAVDDDNEYVVYDDALRLVMAKFLKQS